VDTFDQWNFPCCFSILCKAEQGNAAGGSLLGLVFTGGESPPPAVIKRALDGKTPFTVAADSGLVTAEKAGIKPDFIAGDMDSLEDASRLAAYPHDSIIRHKTEKDHTDTELALFLAIENGCDEIWIAGGGGGRLDHLLGIRSLFERDIFPSRWITRAEDVYCLQSGTARASLSLSLEPGALVSVFPLGSGPWKAGSAGLKWPLDGLVWNRGFFSLSNVAVTGDFAITAEEGRFMVILPLRME
jgi:thiamine pyrophosphokinase